MHLLHLCDGTKATVIGPGGSKLWDIGGNSVPLSGEAVS